MSGDGPGGRLSTDQLEALQRSLGTPLPNQASAVVSADDILSRSAPRAGGEPIVLRYDLVGSSRSESDQLPGLELIHERFARELAAEFRRLIGADGIFSARPLAAPQFAELYSSFQVPTALIVADLKGVGCTCIINMDPGLMMHFLDVMMGGEGGVVSINTSLAVRGFTSTEQGLIKHLVALFSRALNIAWREIADVSLEVQRVATDPRHVALYAPGEQMVELPMTIEWGDIAGIMQLILPMSYLGAFDDDLSRTATPDHVLAAGQFANGVVNALKPVPVDIAALLGKRELTLREVLGFEVGDVIRLDRDPEQPLTVSVEGVPKYTGMACVVHGNLGVEILDPIPHDSYRASGERS